MYIVKVFGCRRRNIDAVKVHLEGRGNKGKKECWEGVVDGQDLVFAASGFNFSPPP
jgi:hypothetical protein